MGKFIIGMYGKTLAVLKVDCYLLDVRHACFRRWHDVYPENMYLMSKYTWIQWICHYVLHITAWWFYQASASLAYQLRSYIQYIRSFKSFSKDLVISLQYHCSSKILYLKILAELMSAYNFNIKSSIYVNCREAYSFDKQPFIFWSI